MRIFPERPVLKLFLINGIMGAGIGVLFATAIIFSDFFDLRKAMEHSVGILVGWALLSYVFACSFAGLAIGTAIMLYWEKSDDDDSDGGLGSRSKNAIHFEHVPVRVRKNNN